MSAGEWFLKVQHATRGGARWLQLGPMTYFQARDEGRRQVRAGRNARLVGPDGKEGPLIMLPATSPASPAKTGELQLNLFSRE